LTVTSDDGGLFGWRMDGKDRGASQMWHKTPILACKLGSFNWRTPQRQQLKDTSLKRHLIVVVVVVWRTRPKRATLLFFGISTLLKLLKTWGYLSMEWGQFLWTTRYALSTEVLPRDARADQQEVHRLSTTNRRGRWNRDAPRSAIVESNTATEALREFR
jgi:hypothetical protein